MFLEIVLGFINILILGTERKIAPKGLVPALLTASLHNTRADKMIIIIIIIIIRKS